MWTKGEKRNDFCLFCALNVFIPLQHKQQNKGTVQHLLITEP